MFSSKIPNSLGINFDPSVPVTKPTLVLLTHLNSTVMWRNIARKVAPRFSSLKAHPSLSTFSFPGLSDSVTPEKLNKLRRYNLSSCPINGLPELGFSRMGRSNWSFNGLCPKSYASVAETIAVSSTDGQEDVSSEDEVQELLQKMGKEVKRGYWKRRRQKSIDGGIGRWKYHKLRRRQVKIETEAWEQAVTEYRNLLKEMCEQKLAPNLPYMKSLFLGWFEPFTNKINEDQELCRQGKSRASYAPYFDQLPADMMSVITMHKFMGLLMTGEGYGRVRVVQAACAVGEAIEQEATNLLPHKCTPCTTTEEKRQTFEIASRIHQMLLKGSSVIIS